MADVYALLTPVDTSSFNHFGSFKELAMEGKIVAAAIFTRGVGVL